MYKLFIYAICINLLLTPVIINAQTTTTINYLTSSLSTSSCNVFNPQVNVGGVTHSSHAGGVVFTTADGIKLPTQQQSGATAFKIHYNFVQGRDYIIKITAKGSNTAVMLKTSVVPNLNQFATNSITSCALDNNVYNYTTTGAATYSTNVTTNSSDYNIPQFTAASNNSYLVVWSTDNGTSVLQALTISKIEITEILNFTMNPLSLSTTCGTAVTKTFTVENPNNIANVTSYEWNLGATPNGWLNNGSAASQNISTSTNSITLTSVCGSIPQNISVTVKVSNANYKTYTIPVTTNAGPALSISTGDLCSGSKTYSINNLPCNATVTWGTPSPSGVVTHTVNNNQITLGYQSDGNVTLSATVTTTNACTTNLVVNNQNIRVGSPYLQATVNGPDTALANSGYYFSLSTNPWNTSISNINWQVPSGWTISTGQGTKFTTIYTGSNNGDVEVEFYDECGQIWNVYKHVIIGQGGNIIPLNVQPVPVITELSVYPNPANNLITVSLSGSSPKTNTNFIKQIRIANKMGVKVLDLKYNDRLQMKQVNISSLKPDIYTIQVYDNKTWHSTKIVKE